MAIQEHDDVQKRIWEKFGKPSDSLNSPNQPSRPDTIGQVQERFQLDPQMGTELYNKSRQNVLPTDPSNLQAFQQMRGVIDPSQAGRDRYAQQLETGMGQFGTPMFAQGLNTAYQNLYGAEQDRLAQQRQVEQDALAKLFTEAGLTGMYQGEQTMQASQFDRQLDQQAQLQREQMAQQRALAQLRQSSGSPSLSELKFAEENAPLSEFQIAGLSSSIGGGTFSELKSGIGKLQIELGLNDAQAEQLYQFSAQKLMAEQNALAAEEQQVLDEQEKRRKAIVEVRTKGNLLLGGR